MKRITYLYISISVVLFLLAAWFFLTKDNAKKISVENTTVHSTEETKEGNPSSTTLQESNQTIQKPIEEETKENKKEENQSVNQETLDEKTPEPVEETSTPSSLVKQNLISWGFKKSSSRKIDTIVIHSSYDALGDNPYDIDGILKEYKQYGVSAHYLIDRKGTVYQLVENKNIAYHAGTSSVPDGRTNVNDFSIGIELMNTKEDKYTSSQYKSLNKLIASLSEQYEIKYILGHDEIAPARKDDPWNFDWKEIDAR